MITVEGIRQKALQRYPAVVAALLRGDDTIFPLVIPADKSLDAATFSDVVTALRPLHDAQKSKRGKGFSIDWCNRRVLGGLQSVPSRIYIETAADFFEVTGKRAEYEAIGGACRELVQAFPQLASWAIQNSKSLLRYRDDWQGIIAVCQYFLAHRRPHPYYLRELPIPVHTKFIEDHAPIIRALLDQLLPESEVDKGVASLAARYGLKTPPVLIRLRVLDNALHGTLGYEECALPLEIACALRWSPKRVFIVENQACYLAFPKVANSVAIWGEGFQARLVMNLPWLREAELFGWFDLDISGFEMLNMSRRLYPHMKSLIMDKDTLQRFANFQVSVDAVTPKTLPRLTSEEQQTYLQLARTGTRLEQERISQQWVAARLSDV